ncbi:23S rRNA (guanosine(2251)-2'-O)-methyltransferase RlmB [Campylobacter fetus]|uniref:23S rRNA (guanosine(2251)-2'-O)-methyltransferase RlmB n=1 Tax=Campylobacter fetus TaxID=196 RepID=UPI000818AA86|nr:23S rRNA (guanosine(2251)-2'-O)-methyltransferase RlmB [Campylobacter fetus]EAH8299763.1 23S rRNA (guanosine(2251)-2'-O)-methyltransferase RlmB [Campylobacter fetus]EAI7232361.1 23S rRNA (guanosine(2251)-2'-O)-methyltransferase RlmB [Campylobacter fetus]EAJ5690090.1 23S rRNA (guanosine(2251)-2'-O)-methyltransferase RlmB [Campylobacter fetus]EAK0428306.1 23S rRNA (guanosine(2251)-2'-O)-methyltransferase RlmB [Campylobacter fetus]EAK5303981.1 23S rRNA (guanosine(2251)-2'-O)-methyltransferase 
MIIYGKQLFLHLLEKHKEKLINIYLAKDIEKDIFNKIVKSGVKIHKVDNKKAQALARGGNHQGFLAEVCEFEFASLNEIKKQDFLVVLYGLSDVGNIGSIVRTTYALGGGGVIMISKSASMEGIIRASSAAAYELPITLVSDGLSLLNELKQLGFKIYGSDAKGKNPSECKFGKKTVLMMGSEGEGIPRKALEKCDENLGINMREGWDSLNVSVAFGILFDRIMNG